MKEWIEFDAPRLIWPSSLDHRALAFSWTQHLTRRGVGVHSWKCLVAQGLLSPGALAGSRQSVLCQSCPATQQEEVRRGASTQTPLCIPLPSSSSSFAMDVVLMHVPASTAQPSTPRSRDRSMARVFRKAITQMSPDQTYPEVPWLAL